MTVTTTCANCGRRAKGVYCARASCASLYAAAELARLELVPVGPTGTRPAAPARST